MVAIGRANRSPFPLLRQSVLTHQAAYPFATASHSARLQLGMNAWATINFVALVANRSHLLP